MAFEPIFNVEGNLLNDPELRFTPNGIAVCNFRVGINDARPDQNNGKQVPPLVAEIAVWRDMAENCAESFVKGTRITAKVRMTELGAYTPRNGGDPVGTLKVEALEVGPSMRWAKAEVTKVAGGQKNQNQQNQGGNQQGNQGGGGWGQNPNQGGGNQGQSGGWGQQGDQGADPWANGQHPGQQGGGNQQGGNGWGSNQSWGNAGGQSGDDPWGQQG